jgi:hypothetical protein
MYVRIMTSGPVHEALTALRAAYDALADADIDLLTGTELLDVLDDVQTRTCRLPSQHHRLLARLQIESTPQQLGAKSWRDVLMTRWRLSCEEANRRLSETALLGPRHTLTGAPLAPHLAATATAQQLGFLTPEHVTIIRTALKRLPGWVDPATREAIEVDWVRHGLGSGPKELHDQSARTLFLLDQDGPLPNDAERARRRGLTKTKQHPDAMTAIKANLTPRAWAVWEVLFARYAAPGMCNPTDEHPCTSGTPTQAQIHGDTRTLDQRRHDAFEHLGRSALHKGELGQLNGLPTTIIVRTTLHELRTLAGIGATGGGTLLPITDVLTMAAHNNATNYLAVFDDATGSALDLFRTRRSASVAQRLALIARDGGCTKPGCTVPAYGAQAHHATRDWTAGGHTNIDDLALACGADNRAVRPHGWSTRLNDHHQVEWLPPPHLDTGQKRTNDYHHPEKLRLPPPHTWPPTKDPNHPHTPDTPDTADWWPVDHHRPTADTGVSVDHAAQLHHPAPTASEEPTTHTDPADTPDTPENDHDHGDGDGDNDARDNGSDTHKPGGPEPPTSTAA